MSLNYFPKQMLILPYRQDDLCKCSDFLIQSSVSVVVKNCTIKSVVKTKTRSYLAKLKDN